MTELESIKGLRQDEKTPRLVLCTERTFQSSLVAEHSDFEIKYLEELLESDAENQTAFGADEIVFTVWVVTDEFLRSRSEDSLRFMSEIPQCEIKIIVLARESRTRDDYQPLPAEFIHLILPAGVEGWMLINVVRNAFDMLMLKQEKLRLQSYLAISYNDIHRITRVGLAMANEHDFDRLLGFILDQAREIVSADGGSIYVIERLPGKKRPTHLRFKQSALNLHSNEFLLPIDKNSVAGFCALTSKPMMIDDVHRLSGNEDYRFNSEFDLAHNYYTRSMMIIPMKNHRDEVIGVIQLINRKRHFEKVLTIEEMKGEEVMPFTEKDLELIGALAGQAAVAIENNLLLQDIHNLFEGFVKASVTAIEQRDPTTFGHSFRVAEFCVGLAESVDRLDSGPFARIRFSLEQIRELRYASLLHDFGKVGVREKVLVKAKKLYGDEIEIIKWRLRYIRRSVERDYLQKKVRFLQENGNRGFDEYEKLLDAEMMARLSEIDDVQRVILRTNEPNVTEEGDRDEDRFNRLAHISARPMILDGGEDVPFLTENEMVSLSVRRGNLDHRERMEIESHVSHTYKFLIQIPWTGDLQNVPDIARGHHEKLDGSGYPLGLHAEEISIQTRMMTISDIYDALTAPDRPYKKSLPAEAALDILKKETELQRLDRKLLDIFIEAGVFRKVSRHSVNY